MVWDEINNNERKPIFFEECYVPPRGHEKNQGIALEILSHRHESDTRSFEHIPPDNITHVIADYSTEKPVVLLGRIGHGKSTFITYLKTVAASEQLKHYIQINIDFIDLPRTSSEVAEYIYRSIEEQLFERYNVDVTEDTFIRAVLHGQIQRFHKSTKAVTYKDNPVRLAEVELQYIEEQMKDKHSLFVRVMQHLKGGRGKSVAIFFDNLDKRTDAIQEEAFLLASAMARDWASLIFICLRPGTFNRSRKSGVLDSIAPRIIQIKSPPMQVFLRRRFDYASAISAGTKEPPRGDVVGISATMASSASEVSTLFDVFSGSVKRNKELTSLIESLSNSNLRLALQYVGGIITSGHLNTGEILEKVNTTGAYTIAIHQSLRAILFGDNVYYEPSQSPFLNLYDAEHADPVEHFVLPICLYHLANVPQDSVAHGYISREELTGKMLAYSLNPSLIENALTVLFARKCIEDDMMSDEWSNTTGRMRISSLGRYHLVELMARFIYLDAVIVDTPIMDDDIRSAVKDVQSLDERLERARLFLRYLHKCAQQVINTPFYTYWERCHDAVASDITDIENSSRQIQ